MRESVARHDEGGPNDLPPPGTGRSVAWNEVAFGPGKASRGTLGSLIDQGIELASRTLYLQCSTVENGSAPDTGGGGAVPLFPTAQIDWGAHGRRHTQLIDVPPGAQIRVPIVCTDLRVTARLLKAFAAATTWNGYNLPGASAEGVPGVGQTFTMSAFCCEGIVGTANPRALIRKLKNSVAGAGVTAWPIAAGAFAVRLIGDPAVFTSYKIATTLASGGTHQVNVPLVATGPLEQLVEIPSGAASILLTAGGAGDFELEYYLAF